MSESVTIRMMDTSPYRNLVDYYVCVRIYGCVGLEGDWGNKVKEPANKKRENRKLAGKKKIRKED